MNTIECQDEILQMMFWMRGEHVAEDVTVEQLLRFLPIHAAAVDAALEQLVVRGLVAAAENRYRLTEAGTVEAGRRFTDAFSSVLGKDGHFSCSDPNCECHLPGFDGTCRSVD